MVLVCCAAREKLMLDHQTRHRLSSLMMISGYPQSPTSEQCNEDKTETVTRNNRIIVSYVNTQH